MLRQALAIYGLMAGALFVCEVIDGSKDHTG